MSLYLIRYHSHNYVVEAETSLNAISKWIDTKQEEENVQVTKRTFKADNFSIEKIGTRNGIYNSIQLMGAFSFGNEVILLKDKHQYFYST